MHKELLNKSWDHVTYRGFFQPKLFYDTIKISFYELFVSNQYGD